MIHIVHLPAEVPRRFVNYPSFALVGPLTAAAWLERQGATVRFWEALLGVPPEAPVRAEGEALLLGAPPSPERVLAEVSAGDLVVFPIDMYRHPEREWGSSVRTLSEAIRDTRPEVTLLVADCHVGGVDYVPLDGPAMLAGLPAVHGYVRGEPELPLAALAGGAALRDVAGVLTRHAEEDGGWATPLDSLQDAPPPAWHLIDVERFFDTQRTLASQDFIHEYHGRGALLPVLSSRGCPYRCRFCAAPPGRRYRSIPAAQFETHLDALVAAGADTLFFLDDVMNLERERFRAVLDALAERGLAWTAVNGLRADRLTARDVRRFQSSGGFGLKVSAESGDPRVLDELVDKNMDPEAPAQVARWAAEADVALAVHYIVGFPGETLEEVNRTLTLALELEELHGASPRVQLATPVPGTALHEDAARGGHLLREVDRFELLGVFEGTPLIDTPELPAGLLVALLALLRRRRARAAEPTLLLDPGYRCNQRCTFCSTALMKWPDRPTAELEQILGRAAARGVRHVDLGGGEPTLYPELPRLVRAARRAGIDDIGVVTNGRMFAYADYAARLRDAGVQRIMLSVAGHTPELHDRIAQAPGAFEQLLAGLEHLAASGLPLTLNGVICRSTAPHLAELATYYASRWDFELVNLQVALPMGNAVAERESFDAFEEFLPSLRAALAVKDLPPVQVHNLPPCVLPERPDVVLAESFKGGRLILDQQSEMVDFAGVVGRVLTALPFCARCPAYLACGGVPKRMRSRYVQEHRWPDRVVQALLEPRTQAWLSDDERG